MINMTMRALLITCFPDSNGIGKYARLYGKNLENSGYSVETLYLQTPEQFGKNVEHGTGRLVVKNFALGVFYLFKKAVKKYLSGKENSYDLHVITTPLLLPLVGVLPKERTEVILLDAYAYSCSIRPRALVASIVQILYIWRYVREPIKVVFISHYTKNEFTKYIGKQLRKISSSVFELPLKLLKTGVEYFDLPPQLWGKDIFLNVGRDTPHKNVGTFLKVAQHYSKDSTKIFIRVGSPSGETLRYIKSNKIDNLVHMRNLKERQLNYLYSISKAYIHSAYFEGLGLPPLEAYAHGCYVISTKCSDLHLYFKGCDTHTFIDNPNDVGKYIEAIENLYSGIVPTRCHFPVKAAYEQ